LAKVISPNVSQLAGDDPQGHFSLEGQLMDDGVQIHIEPDNLLQEALQLLPPKLILVKVERFGVIEEVLSNAVY